MDFLKIKLETIPFLVIPETEINEGKNMFQSGLNPSANTALEFVNSDLQSFKCFIFLNKVECM